MQCSPIGRETNQVNAHWTGARLRWCRFTPTNSTSTTLAEFGAAQRDRFSRETLQILTVLRFGKLVQCQTRIGLWQFADKCATMSHLSMHRIANNATRSKWLPVSTLNAHCCVRWSLLRRSRIRTRQIKMCWLAGRVTNRFVRRQWY